MDPDGLDALARRVSQGDSEAFRTLCKAHVGTVYRYVQYKVGDPQVAEDLTRQTLLDAAQTVRRYQWQEMPFQHWLLRLARNAVVDHYRRSGGYRAVP